MPFSLEAIPLGLVVGIALGALGGGGSMLTVPALVYLLGEHPRAATRASLLIVGITALTGTVGHARDGRVRWLPGLVFGVVGIGGSLLGSRLNTLVNPNVLLLAFAVLMLVTSGAMLWRQHASGAGESSSATPATVVSGALHQTARRVAGIAVAGTVVGFLTGFFGVGGGFVVVPALVLALGFGMGEAVGTGLLVTAINTVVALTARGWTAPFDWHVVAPFTAAAMAGSLVGNRVASAVPAATLVRAFAVLLVCVAVYVGARSLLALR